MRKGNSSSARARGSMASRVIALVSTFFMATTILALPPAPAAHAGLSLGSELVLSLPVTPDTDPEEVLAAAIERLAQRLDELPTMEDLQDAIPLTDETLADALNLVNVFDNLVSQMNALAMDGANPSAQDIQNAIHAASTPHIDLTGSTVTDNDPDFEVSLVISISRSSLLDLSPDDSFPISGGSINVTATADASIDLYLDESAIVSNLDESVWIVGTPEITFGATATGALAFMAQLGFTDVDVTGTADLNLDAKLTLQDPDPVAPSNGKITYDEFDATALEDLLTFSIVDEADPVADVNFSIASSLLPTDGTFTYVLQNIGETPTVGGDLGDLADFENFTIGEAYAAFDRLAALLGGLQTTGRLDVQLPLVGGSINDVINLESKVRDAMDAMVTEDNDGIDNDFDGDIDELGEDPIIANFVSAQTLETVLETIPGIGDVVVAHNGDVLTYTLSISDSATKDVYVGNTPPASDEDPLRLRFPDLDILTGVEITAGGTATLDAEYSLDLTFGFDLTQQPGEDGAGHGSCFDGIDNGDDGDIDAVDDDCTDAPNLIERIFLDVGAVAGSPEGTARASLSASGINAEAIVGILNTGITGATVDIDGPSTTGNKAEVTVDFFDSDDGRLTVGDLFDVLGDSPDAPGTAGVQTSLIANFAATVPVSASVGGTTLSGGNILLTSSVAGPVSNIGQLIENLNIDTSGLSGTDIFNFSPCSNNIDDDGDGVVNDGCPGSGVDANDSPESESTASMTQIIAAVRAFAQSLDGVGGGVLDEPIPLVGKSLGDLIDFSDVVLEVAQDLENPAEGDGSMDGGSDCANSTDDDGDGVVNDGCPTEGDAPEGGGLAATTSEHCANSIDDDGDGVVNDGCPTVDGTLGSVASMIEDALQDALDSVLGQDIIPTTVNVAVDYNATENDVTFNVDLAAPYEVMGSFNVALGDSDLVGLDAAGDVGIDVEAGLDLDFGIDLDDVTPFVLGSSGFSIEANASAADLTFMANIGPLEFAVGSAGDEGSINLGAQFEVGVTGGATDRIPFSSIGFDAPSFDGIAQAACNETVAGTKDDACAILPLYLNGEPVAASPGHQIQINLPDITDPTSIDVVFPDLSTILEEALLDFALAESGLARLIQLLTDVLVDGVLAVDFPLIGDELQSAARFIDGLNQGDGTAGSNGVAGIITDLLSDGDPIEIAAKALTDLGNEQEAYVELSVTPTNEEQTITTGGATAGTFNVSLDGGTPAAINFDDDGAAVTTALEGLTEIGAGNVVATGGAGGDWDIEFIGDLAEADVSQLAVADIDLADATLDASTTQEGISGGTFTLKRSDGTDASDPIAWNASAADVEAALESATAAGDTGITSVSVTGSGEVGDPWVIKSFTPDNPGKLINDDTNLGGTSTVELVTVIPTIGEVQTELDTLLVDMKQALYDADILLASVNPIVPATGPGDGVADVMLLCDGAGGIVNCSDDAANASEPATKIEGVRFDILLGQEATASTDIGFDIGVPGLNLAANGSPTVTGEWHLDFGFGITKDDGFFIDTESPDELFAGVSAELGPDNPTPAISGRIAFIGIDIYDGTEGLDRCATLAEPGGGTLGPCATHEAGETPLPQSSLSAAFRINLTDPNSDNKLTFSEMTNVGSIGDVVVYNVQAVADVNLHLESKISNDGSLPRVYADLELDWAWNFGNGNVVGGDFNGQACAEFSECFMLDLNNTAMDAGSFVTNFLGPVLENVQEFTRPLQPVIDTLNEPIPVLSDLGAGPVTMLSLAEVFGPSDNKYDLIFQLVKLVDFINGIEARSGQRLIIPLGTDNDYSLDVGRLLGGPLAPEQSTEAFTAGQAMPSGSLVDGGGALNSFNVSSSSSAKTVSEVKSGTGLSFPFLEEPAKVLGLLFGQDVDLIVWRPEPLSFGFSYSQKFGPIWAVPPVFLEVGGSVSVTGRFGIGYDTQGLREILFEDAGPEALLHGVFLLDRDASGRDVNELELKGELFANAQVSVLIFSAGAGGSVYATIGIDLQDPNSDGKLKFPEIADIVRATGNPFCIFNLNGEFGVKMFVFAEVDLFFWSKRWRKDLANIVLYEFKVECDPNALVEPVLAAPTAAGAPAGTPSGDVLRLNLGAHRGGRDANGPSIGADVKDELFTVTQEVDGSLTVESLGFIQNYKAPDGTWDAVWADGSADGDDGADTIFLLDGGDEAPTSESDLDAAETPFTVPAYIVGSGGDDVYITGDGNDVVSSGDGADTIDTRDGADSVDGGNHNDSIAGGPGDDNSLDGGEGADYIDGGPGADTINGGGGNDELLGGADQKASETVDLPDGIDTIHGNGGEDDIDGGPGNDKLWGDADRDTIRGASGDDEIHGGSGGNETSCPTDNTGPGAGPLQPGGDVLYGGPGIDTIHGDGGDDIVIGGLSITDSPDDGDNLFGDDGCDTLYGDNVDINSSGDVTPQQTIDGDLFGADSMSGGEDSDLLFGQGGGDTMAGDNGDDVLNGNDGNDTMYGDDEAGVAAGDGIDIMSGDDGVDTMYGGGANDEMFGDKGNDIMFGNGGDDLMRGGQDNDQMSGNADADEMYGDSGNDTMWGDAATPGTGDGADDMRGGSGSDEMFGNADGDEMRGDSDDDRMVGGSAQLNAADGDDEMRGGSGADVMIGDNGVIADGADVHSKLVTLRLDDEGAGDVMFGDGQVDRMFGQFGDDEIHGGESGDYIEGNQGSDDIFGDAFGDDIIGGSSSGDGVIDATRVGTGRPDAGDTIDGGTGPDRIAGDNARFTRVSDQGSSDAIVLFDVNSTDTNVSGGDTIIGGSANDLIFGQGNGAQPATQTDPVDLNDNDLDGDIDEDGVGWLGDSLYGGDGHDYIEGNHGSDLVDGGDGNDDLIGGGSANDGTVGVIDDDRLGTGLDDARDTMHGGLGEDFMAGDNALISRNFGTSAPLVLFDVNSTDSATNAGDWMSGGDGPDRMFGQGNGTQPAGQRDPLDGGIDNDLDGVADEDQPWQGDVMFGGTGTDYMEGNHGADLMLGGADNDDMVGGGSARDAGTDETGTIDGSRSGTGLKDAGDAIYGEGGDDWIAGDNALVERNVELGAPFDLRLFDVNSSGTTVSGGDYISGGDDSDRIFGQGNGVQPAAQDDPRDGVDSDADGDTDNAADQPWDGDVLYGDGASDYMEGNHGSDVMWGGTGDDNMIGGGSATNGIVALDGGAFNTARTGNGLNDRGDVMRGEAGVDFMTGDNARVDIGGTVTGLVLQSDRSVQLFDIEIAGVTGDVSAYSGGDWMSGGADEDVMLGQGNGEQASDQADPLDGVDNDLDGQGMEDPSNPDSLGYDCDDGVDNDGDGNIDAADAQCPGANIDEDQPWLGDVMFGDGADDYMEGNHGSDWMFGNDGEDDMAGGGSAADGAIVPGRVGTDLADGHDVMHGNDEDDVMAGDNATINRVLNGAGTDWERLDSGGIVSDYGPFNQAIRVTTMETTPEADGAYGDDYMTGGTGNDEMYGQLGSDFVRGDLGDDALVGDLGQVTANLLGDGIDDPALDLLLETNSPHWNAFVNETGSMQWNAELFSFDTSQGGVGGNDILLGFDGRDTVFGGPGDDLINGDGDGVDEFLDAVNPEFSHITDISPGSDVDFIFGGDDNDVMWGGRDNDLMFGGHGADYLDVRPRQDWDNGKSGNKYVFIPADPPEWFTYAFPENLQDVDFMYGGWDADAMQADQAANGPDPGDRMVDWVGGYNVFYVCPAGYGDFTITRMGSPFGQTFLQEYAEASGAYDTLTDGSSGFRDVAYVFNNERGRNARPPNPDHAAHFNCVDF